MKSMLAPERQPASVSSNPDVEAGRLSDSARAIHELIAGRAYQFFEARGYEHGHDMDDWLNAESEILIPIDVDKYDIEDKLIARVRVPARTAEDLEVTIEPRRIIVVDRDRPNIDGNNEANPPKRLFHTIALPDQVDWVGATMSFNDGVLEVVVPRLSNASV